MTSELQKRFAIVSGQVKQQFFERDRIVDAAFTAILSRQHMLQLGVPGSAKSMVTVAICDKFEGASYFEWLLTRFSTPEELYGPVSLKGLENDEYRRVTDSKLPQAHIAFLDEIFKGNSAILNSLLRAINERKFDNGKKHENIPLLSVFGASNELPEEKELEALYDRFILRYWVPYIQDGDNWEQLLLNAATSTKSKQKGTTITLDDLTAAQAEVKTVKVPKAIVSTMREIKLELEREGIICSDRRWSQTITVLQAWAWLHLRDEVTSEDLELLCDMLWHEPDQRKVLVSKILSVTNPLDLEAMKFLDDCKDVYSRFNSKDSANVQETATKLRAALEQIDDKMKYADATKTAKLKEVRGQIGDMYKGVLKALNI